MVKRKERPEAYTENDHGTPITQSNVDHAAKRQFVALHRVRSIGWNPTAAIACAATEDSSLLAVARESGIIEIWDTEHWVPIGVSDFSILYT